MASKSRAITRRKSGSAKKRSKSRRRKSRKASGWSDQAIRTTHFLAGALVGSLTYNAMQDGVMGDPIAAGEQAIAKEPLVAAGLGTVAYFGIRSQRKNKKKGHLGDFLSMGAGAAVGYGLSYGISEVPKLMAE